MLAGEEILFYGDDLTSSRPSSRNNSIFGISFTCQVEIPCNSSSSGGFVPGTPFCSNGQVMCNSGVPACVNILIPIPVCGSTFGFTGELGGPGCTNLSRTLFNAGAASCAPPARVALSTDELQCTKNNLCPQNKKRVEPCRENKASCECVCPFNLKHQKNTPRCSKNDLPVCSKDLLPICSNPNNAAACYKGKLFCQDIDVGPIDLTDKVFCRKIRKEERVNFKAPRTYSKQLLLKN